MTGAATPLGERLARNLIEGGELTGVFSLDRHRSRTMPAEVRARPVDLTREFDVEAFASRITEEDVGTLLHLGLPGHPLAASPLSGARSDAERDVASTRRLLRVATSAGVRRIVLASTTMVYAKGAHPSDRRRQEVSTGASRRSPWLEGRKEVERIVEQWGAEREGREVCILRAPWVTGSLVESPFLDYLRRPRVPLVWGYDPPLQLLHESDWLHALESAAMGVGRGVLDVVGKETLPIRSLVARAGREVVSLPLPVLERTAELLGVPRLGGSRSAFFDYLRFPWLADGQSGWDVFGEPHYSTQEAWAALAMRERKSRSVGRSDPQSSLTS
jgi:UDP-glucose 4-epimerase